MSAPLPIAVLISGSGTTLRNLIERIEDGSLLAEIRLVISSNSAAKGLEFAKAAGLKSLIVEKKKELSDDQFSEAVFGPCRAAGVQFVVMGGFLKHVVIPLDFQNRVINIHPALLPKFGGKGMYGLKVHEAVIATGEKVSGCTVHFVDNEYDHGPIILQRQVAVLAGDTSEALQRRVFAAECEAYPEVLRALASKIARS
jgi:phosphoribosylglycinamide formyltransferase 1